MEGKTAVILFLGVFAALVVWMVVRGIRRQRGIKTEAAKLGLRYQWLDEELQKKLLGKLPIFTWDDISIFNVLSGTTGGAAYHIFEFSYIHRNNVNRRRDSEKVGTVACFEMRGEKLARFRLWPKGKRRGEQGNLTLDAHPEFSRHFEAQAENAEAARQQLSSQFLDAVVRTRHQNWGIEGGGEWLAFSRYFGRDEERMIAPDKFAEFHRQILELQGLLTR